MDKLDRIEENYHEEDIGGDNEDDDEVEIIMKPTKSSTNSKLRSRAIKARDTSESVQKRSPRSSSSSTSTFLGNSKVAPSKSRNDEFNGNDDIEDDNVDWNRQVQGPREV